jgi:CheY-like chemotaxis protein
MLLTGAFEPVDQAKATAAGCDGVLAKPFEPQLVIGRVRELLSKPKQVAAATSAPAVSPSAPPKPVAAPVVEAPRAPAKPKISDGADYFDRLDQAFANLAAPPDNETRSVADAIDSFAKSHPSDKPVSTVPPFAERWDPPSLPQAPAPSQPVAQTPPPPISQPAPPAVSRPSTTDVVAQSKPVEKPIEAAPAKPVETAPSKPFEKPFETPRAQAAASAIAPSTFPPLADAFAALLAAEQGESSDAPVWPAALTPAAAVTDDLIEQVTRRVLERLSDRVMREAVAEKISAVAERLVREEIDRIKNSIK